MQFYEVKKRYDRFLLEWLCSAAKKKRSEKHYARSTPK
jgi:hypothetical protein